MTWMRSTVAAASLALPAGSAIAGDVAYGEYLSAECVTCHQVDGVDSGIPSIIGWSEESMISVLTSYREKERGNPVMQTIATSLGEDEMSALAAYFASLRPAAGQ